MRLLWETRPIPGWTKFVMPISISARSPALGESHLIQSKAALLNIAAKAPHLPPEYQADFIALTDECFIKAVELRLQRPSPDQLEAAL